MGIGTKIGIFILLCASLSSCDKFEMRGFVTGHESANDRFVESMEWNADHPNQNIDVNSEDYSIFVMGDSHVGGTENLDFFLGEATAANASAAVMVGDITTGHAEDFQTFHQHLPEADVLRTFQITGNHDLYFNGWKEFYRLFGSSTYFFSVVTPEAMDLYICLDSGSGTLGSKQLDWFKAVLRTERNAYRHCVVFTHNNIFRIRHTTSTNPFIEEVRMLAELSIEFQIDMLITGHDHKKNEVTFGNTLHITMDALQDISNDPGYSRINVTDGQLEHEFVNFK
jgi:predicted phosphodiesterase